MLTIKVAVMIKASLMLAALILDGYMAIAYRLQRRPTGRHRRHDTPRLELPRLRREPSQFQDDTLPA